MIPFLYNCERQIHGFKIPIVQGTQLIKPKLLILKTTTMVREKLNDISIVIAAKRGQLNSIKQLIDLGSDVNSIDRYEMTALDYASMKGNIEIAKYLIGCGATINKGGYFGATPLGYAVEKNDLEMMALLIKCGAVIPDFFCDEPYSIIVAQTVYKTAA